MSTADTSRSSTKPTEAMRLSDAKPRCQLVPLRVSVDLKRAESGLTRLRYRRPGGCASSLVASCAAAYEVPLPTGTKPPGGA